MNAVEFAGSLGGKIEPSQGGELGIVPDRRYAAEADIGRQLLLPHFDQRIEIAAVRTTVMEELQHFDLARIIGRLGRIELGVGILGQRQIGKRDQRTACGKLLQDITTIHSVMLHE